MDLSMLIKMMMELEAENVIRKNLLHGSVA